MFILRRFTSARGVCHTPLPSDFFSFLATNVARPFRFTYFASCLTSPQTAQRRALMRQRRQKKIRIAVAYSRRANLRIVEYRQSAAEVDQYAAVDRQVRFHAAAVDVTVNHVLALRAEADPRIAAQNFP